MGHREHLSDGDEWDALTRGKRFYIWRAGDRKQIKRRFNRRIRRLAKALDRPNRVSGSGV